MIDLSHIPETPGLSVFLPQSVDVNSWQSWQKPRGFVMASIYAIGPGGGGGAGGTGTQRGGGAGGGSGGLSRLTIPLFLLPDTLYVRVTPGGSGGAGVEGNTNGTAGNVAFAASSTLVSVYPSTTAQYLFLEAIAGSGGGGGTTVDVSGGAGATISATTSAPLGNLGATLFIAGNAGGTGSGTGSGGSITQGTNSQIYGGAGGGGRIGNISRTGGGINALANTPFLASAAGLTGSTIGGGSGFNWSTVFPGKIYGGTGGASNDSFGTAGGNGAVYGAGGGGGGASSSSSVGQGSGRGGDGGPGCVIIQCW